MIDTEENNVNEVEEKKISKGGTKKTSKKATNGTTNTTKTPITTKSKTTVTKKTSTAKTTKTKTNSNKEEKAKKTDELDAVEKKKSSTSSRTKKNTSTTSAKKTQTTKKSTSKSSSKTTKSKAKAIEPKDEKTKEDIVEKVTEKKSENVSEKVKEKVDNTIEEVDLPEMKTEDRALSKELGLNDVPKAEIDEEDDSKYDTISLKEIREALENKVDSKQKKSVIKDILINFGLAIVMVLHLILIMFGCKNISPETLDMDIKIITLFILLLGIVMLEISYKKDNFKIAMHGIEVLVFGAANLCLIYIAKLYYNNLIRFLGYIGLTVAVYYIVKSTIISVRSIRKFKKDNNDIKDIVQKKNNIED